MSDPLAPPAAFLTQIETLGLAFESGDLDRLRRFLELLLEANTRFNLTRVTDPADAWTRHVFDSLTLVPVLASAEVQRVVDIGSGGGPPGLPLAIVMSDVRFTLVESTGKKARFLEETTKALGLANVEIVNDRAETIGRDRERHREQYDAATARAVGRLPVFLELAVPLVRIGGHVVAIKGEQAMAEIDEAKAALHMLHATVVESRRTPTGTIVVVEKQRRTPKMYPRAPGEPGRVPLGGRSVGL